MGAGVPPGLQNRCAVERRWAGSIPVRLRYLRQRSTMTNRARPPESSPRPHLSTLCQRSPDDGREEVVEFLSGLAVELAGDVGVEVPVIPIAETAADLPVSEFRPSLTG